MGKKSNCPSGPAMHPSSVVATKYTSLRMLPSGRELSRDGGFRAGTALLGPGLHRRDTLFGTAMSPHMPPIPVIETDRLILRAHAPGDFSECKAMWGNPDVTRHIGGRPSSGEE